VFALPRSPHIVLLPLLQEKQYVQRIQWRDGTQVSGFQLGIHPIKLFEGECSQTRLGWEGVRSIVARPGSIELKSRLSGQMKLVHVLRAHLLRRSSAHPGWESRDAEMSGCGIITQPAADRVIPTSVQKGKFPMRDDVVRLHV
jgi:hypothetical protein